MTYLQTVKTAQEVVEGARDHVVNEFESDERDKAIAAGVTRTEYVDYVDALENYQSRDDVEPLVERRAREAAADFADQSFRRSGVGSIAVLTSPADGNVGPDTPSGYTPDPAVPPTP